MICEESRDAGPASQKCSSTMCWIFSGNWDVKTWTWVVEEVIGGESRGGSRILNGPASAFENACSSPRPVGPVCTSPFFLTRKARILPCVAYPPLPLAFPTCSAGVAHHRDHTTSTRPTPPQHSQSRYLGRVGSLHQWSLLPGASRRSNRPSHRPPVAGLVKC